MKLSMKMKKMFKRDLLKKQTRKEGFSLNKLTQTFLVTCLLFVFGFALAPNAEAANPIPQAERNALLDLYNSTDGNNWVLNGGWGGAVGTECGWQGVACYCEIMESQGTPCAANESDFIMGISLENNNLSGTLPSSLANIQYLVILDFNFNNLTGGIPSSFSNMTYLTVLFLWDNSMSGAIPDFSNLQYLEELDVEGNNFTSYAGNSLPTSLIDFWATDNNFSDGEVSRILSLYLDDLASRPTDGIIDLSGNGMGWVDPQGMQDVATLESHGFEVRVNAYTDTDNDGFYAEVDDCDDTDENINPDATEVCDGEDNDCDAGTEDGSGETAQLNPLQDGVCLNSTQTCQTGAWTNDYSSVANYEADEELSCDGLDNDCDGEEDEDGNTTTYFQDADFDGFGDGLEDTDQCTQPVGYVENQDDCDDTDGNVNPDAVEICDGIDNNCDGNLDEGFTLETFYEDEDSDGYGDPNNFTEACTQPIGYVTDNTDCADSIPEAHPGGTEICGDLVDQDCDGSDLSCDDVDDDNDGFTENEGDCNDNDVSINPDAAEACNGIDDNCDGSIDEGLALTTFYLDADSDFYGDSSSSQEACAEPAGYVDNNTDCDDSDSSANPDATEICDDVDNNCSGENNEGLAVNTYYEDTDSDNYGDSSSTQDYCAQPDGYVDNDSDCDDSDDSINPGATEVACDNIDQDCSGSDEEGTDSDNDGFKVEGGLCGDVDCDDTDENINPDATEICDGVDNNCDGNTDEGFDFVDYYADDDEDSYGDPGTSQSSCSAVDGYVTNDEDCDDMDDSINPDGEEVCDGADNNCNGETDEGFDLFTYFRDADSDTFGSSSNSQEACMQPAGYVTDNTDCDDSDSDSNPDGEEVCDGVDNNCNGEVDEDIEDCEVDDDDDDDSDDDDDECGDLDVEDVKIKNITETSVVISFETSNKADGYIRYGTSKNDLDKKKKFSKDKDHKVTITGLTPGEKYYFKIKAEDRCDQKDYSKTKSFTTKEKQRVRNPQPRYDYLDDDNDGEDTKEITENIEDPVLEVAQVEDVNTDEGSTDEDVQVIDSIEGAQVAGVSDESEGECQSWPPFWVWLLLLLIILATFIYGDYRNYDKKVYGWKLDLAIFIGAILFWYFFDKCRVYYWFLFGSTIGGIVTHVVYAMTLKKENEESEKEEDI